MTTQEFVDWFYAQEETPEPSDMLAVLNRLHAVKCAELADKEITHRSNGRGWKGLKLWEVRILREARKVTGGEQPKTPSFYSREP